MSHESRFSVIGGLTAPTIALAKAQRDAYIAAEHRVLEAHDDLLFNAAVASLQSLLTAIDPTAAGTFVASQVDTGCSDLLHVTPYVQMSKAWQLPNPASGLHSWATSMVGLTAADQALALAQAQAAITAQGRSMEAGDTIVFNALVSACLSWTTALAVTTTVRTSMSASVSDGSLNRINASLGITTDQPVAAAPNPLAAVLTPPPMTGTVNNYNPASLAAALYLRLSGTALVTLTGIAGGSGTRELRIYNVGSSNITLAASSALSLAANRFLMNGNLLLNPNEGAILAYDPVALGWRVLGAFI